MSDNSELIILSHQIAGIDRYLDSKAAGAYQEEPLAQDWARIAIRL
jgi:hypothetical protein